MQETETTQTPLPTPTEVATAPPTEEAAAPPPPDAEPPAPEPEAEAEPKSPWDGVSDVYDLMDLPEVKEHLERRDRRSEQTLREDFQRQYDEATKRWEGTQAHNQLAGIYGSLLQKLEDGDSESVSRLIDRLEKAVEPYSEPYRQQLQGQGAQASGQQFLGVLRDSLPQRAQDEFMDFILTSRSASWGDILKKRDTLAETSSKKPLQDKVTSLEAQIEQLNAKLRDGQGPDTAEKGGGGVSVSTARLRQMTTSEINELRKRPGGQEAIDKALAGG